MPLLFSPRHCVADSPRPHIRSPSLPLGYLAASSRRSPASRPSLFLFPTRFFLFRPHLSRYVLPLALPTRERGSETRSGCCSQHQLGPSRQERLAQHEHPQRGKVHRAATASQQSARAAGFGSPPGRNCAASAWIRPSPRPVVTSAAARRQQQGLALN